MHKAGQKPSAAVVSEGLLLALAHSRDPRLAAAGMRSLPPEILLRMAVAPPVAPEALVLLLETLDACPVDEVRAALVRARLDTGPGQGLLNAERIARSLAACRERIHREGCPPPGMAALSALGVDVPPQTR